MSRVYVLSDGGLPRICEPSSCYGVATISRLLKIIGLFCKRALHKRPIFSKEICDFKEPTNRSHPISCICMCHIYVTQVATWVTRGTCDKSHI